MTTTHETGRQETVIDLLVAQHEEIKSLFRAVGTATGPRKQELFHDLVRLLAVHESAEEEVVHPAARDTAGDSVVQARLDEEDKAKKVLAELYDLGVDADGFDAKLNALAVDVIAHAEHEEHEEFVTLRQRNSDEQLRKMAGAVRAAEAIAPTRPHPTAGESATANLLAGPPLAVFDRIRDAVRDWRTGK
jgi:hemerythrin superfamily protein